MSKADTSHNYLRFGGSGYEKPQSGLHPLCGFSPQYF